MSTDPAKSPLLEMRSITKRFPGVVALNGVSLALRRGEVLALMGENGAGKSTLMKVLGGACLPEEGQVLIDGVAVSLGSVREAKRHRVALIHQELMLADNLDIAANVFLGNERRRGGVLNLLGNRAMHRDARRLMERVGLKVTSSTSVSSLTPGQMQMVEIAKALSSEARILVMDEPTSSLTAGESAHLFSIIRQLRSEGIGIIYISHRLEEVLALADRITVLRDGRHVGDLSRDEATHDKLVAMMVGRELSTRFPDRRAGGSAEEEVLAVEDLLVAGAATGVSFTARRGEVLGFAGLIGSGRTELMQTIFGAAPALGGSMRLVGKLFHPRDPHDAIEQGVYLAPEDRKRHGLVLPMTVAENTTLADVANYEPRFCLNRRRERRVAAEQVRRLAVRTPGIQQRCVNLSGGNQQKVVLGRWLAMRPRVLILDEPTRGIDVGAKHEIYRQIAELAERGITVLLVSSEMEELIGLSDRVVVMQERRIEGVLTRAQLSPESIGALMTGRTHAA